MNTSYIYDKSIQQQDLNIALAAEYDNCVFKNLDFTATRLANIHFSKCVFEGCNLAMVDVGLTSFRNVQFKDCKMLGIKFHQCNDVILGLKFQGCQLNYSSFYKLKIKNTSFKQCSLVEVDFSLCDLTQSTFDECELGRAIFDDAVLDKVDFTTSRHYTIDLNAVSCKKTKFSASGLRGLLSTYDIVVSD